MERGWKGFLLLLWGYLVLLALRGKGAHGVLLLAAVLPPILRAIFSREYRRSWETWPKAYFVALAMFALCLLNGRSISSFDNYGTILIARSLIVDHDTEISEHVMGGRSVPCQELPYYLTCTPKGVYSVYPIGMALYFTPFLLLSKWAGGDIDDPTVQWRMSKLVAALTAALILALIFQTATTLASPPAAMWMAVFLGMGSGLLSTVGQGLYSHDGVMLGMALLLYLEIVRRGQFRYRILVWALIFAWMMAVRTTAACFLLPFGVWIFSRHRWDVVKAVALSLGLFALVCLYNQNISGHPLGPYFVVVSRMAKTISFSRWTAFWGSLVSPARGFFVYQPWALLLVLLPWRNLRPWMIVLLVAMGLQLFLISSWPEWDGGYCWGSRLMVEWVLPGALLVAFVLNERRLKVSYLVSIAVISAAMHFPYVFGHARFWMDDPKPADRAKTIYERYWDWKDFPPLYDCLR